MAIDPRKSAPPNFDDPEAELEFLAAVVRGQQVLDEFDGTLESEDFSRDQNRRAFKVFLDLHQANVYLQDFAVVVRELESGGKFSRAEAQAFMGRLSSGIPESAGFHADLIIRASKKRRLFSALADASSELETRNADPVSISGRLEAELGMISSARSVDHSRTIEDCAGKAMDDIRSSMTEKKILGIPTGLFGLDGVFGGWHNTELSMVAGQPGQGKTAFALQTGKFAADRGYSVWIASLEMSEMELAKRYLCSDAGVDSQELRTGQLSKESLERLEDALARLKGVTLRIWDPSDATMAQISAEARRVKASHGLDLIIVDYISLIEPGPDTRKLEIKHQVGDSAKKLKRLARKLEVPVVCLSQVNREGVKSGRLRKHHLAESSEVERNADNIIFLNDGDEPGEVIVGIEKQRNGPTGEVKLHFDGNGTRFRSSMEMVF